MTKSLPAGRQAKRKINSKFRYQMPKQKFFHLCLCICAYFVICAYVFGITNAYAFDLEKIKVSFLKGDYKSAIIEGEKILAQDAHPGNIDELYYILGLSYLKDGNYLRASDIFEIILRELKDSKFREGAELGLGDSYFLRGDFDTARKYYEELIASTGNVKLKAEAFYRLSQLAFKKGDTARAKEYLDKAKQDYPLNPELELNKDLNKLSRASGDIYYTVQVGVFSKQENAAAFRDKLSKKGFSAYIDEAEFEGVKAYRVRVGKVKSPQEAAQLESNLSAQGYPTKIYP